MSEKNITFEEMPKAMSWMIKKLSELDSKIDDLATTPKQPVVEQWMNLRELCDYGWTSCHLIPFHKKGKRIMFLKEEIDAWLHEGKIKSHKELSKEAEEFIKSKRHNRF